MSMPGVEDTTNESWRDYGQRHPSSGGALTRTSRLFFVMTGLSLPFVAINPTALAGDPGIYLTRLTQFFDGNIPYLQAQFEHLPLALVPILFAWLLGGWINPLFYTIVFAALMAGCLWATAKVLDHIGSGLERPDAGVVWLWLTAPLFPLVLFRTDPWPLLLATVASAALAANRRGAAAGWTLLGVLAKGWPVVLAVVEWFRGRRTRATIVLLLSACLFAGLWAFPEFRSGRAFTGTHTDSMAGSTLALIRAVRGDSVGRFDAAGAIYLEAPGWAVLVNAHLGVLVGALAMVRLRRPLTEEFAVRLASALVLALLVASPLLSPQFIIWPTAFLALHSARSVHVITSGVVILTLAFMLGWNPVYEGTLWWLPLVVLRNFLLLALGFLVSWSVGSANLEKRPA